MQAARIAKLEAGWTKLQARIAKLEAGWTKLQERIAELEARIPETEMTAKSAEIGGNRSPIRSVSEESES